jgi:type IV pilus assembly protein PilE
VKHHTTGFTLIELMVVVAVIAILATVAFPSYSRYMVRMHRAQAQSYLMEIAQRQQQYFLDSREYASEAKMLGIDPVPAQVAAQYVVTIGPNAPTVPPTFLVAASPRPGSLQAAYSESNLSIAQDGSKSPTSAWQ